MIFGKRNHAQGDVNIDEIVDFWIISEGTSIGTSPYYAIFISMKSINETGLIAWQMISLKRALPAVIASQTVASTYPESVVQILGYRAYIVIRDDAWRIGIIAIVFETIAIERSEPLVGTYPHHTIVIEDELSGFFDALDWRLRHDSE